MARQKEEEEEEEWIVWFPPSIQSLGAGMEGGREGSVVTTTTRTTTTKHKLLLLLYDTSGNHQTHSPMRSKDGDRSRSRGEIAIAPGCHGDVYVIKNGGNQLKRRGGMTVGE